MRFALVKSYGGVYAPYQRPIAKPIAGSVRVAVDGVEAEAGTAFTCDRDDRHRDVPAGPCPGRRALR